MEKKIISPFVLAVLSCVLCLIFSCGSVIAVIRLPQLIAESTATPKILAYGLMLFAIAVHLLFYGQYKYLLPYLDYRIGIWTVLFTWMVFFVAGFATFVVFISVLLKYVVAHFELMGVLVFILSILLMVSFCYIFCRGE